MRGAMFQVARSRALSGGLALLLGLIVIILFIVNEVRSRRNKMAYGFEVLPTNLFILKLAFLSLVLAALTWMLAGYNGLSWTVVIMPVMFSPKTWGLSAMILTSGARRSWVTM